MSANAETASPPIQAVPLGRSGLALRSMSQSTSESGKLAMMNVSRQRRLSGTIGAPVAAPIQWPRQPLAKPESQRAAKGGGKRSQPRGRSGRLIWKAARVAEAPVSQAPEACIRYVGSVTSPPRSRRGPRNSTRAAIRPVAKAIQHSARSEGGRRRGTGTSRLDNATTRPSVDDIFARSRMTRWAATPLSSATSIHLAKMLHEGRAARLFCLLSVGLGQGPRPDLARRPFFRQ